MRDIHTLENKVKNILQKNIPLALKSIDTQ